MLDLATLALCVGTFGLAAALGSGPPGFPVAAWVVAITAPVAALLVGAVIEADAGTERVRRLARWLQAGGAVAWLGLFASAVVEHQLGQASTAGLVLAAFGVWPSGAALVRVARGRGVPRRSEHLGALAAEVADGAPRTVSMRARIVGSEAITLVVLGLLAVAGGLVLLVHGPEADRRLGVLCILLCGAAIPLGIRNGLARWAAVVGPARRVSPWWGGLAVLFATSGLLFDALFMNEHPLWVRIGAGVGAGVGILASLGWVFARYRHRLPVGDIVWIAREGIVEESDGTILFPWEHLVGFELIERHGRPAVRVWLQEQAKTPFLLLDSGHDAAEVARRAERRRRRLEQTRAFAGAPLLLRDGGPGRTAGEVYRTLVRVAREPETVQTLPSVLDDPPPIDLGPLPPKR